MLWIRKRTAGQVAPQGRIAQIVWIRAKKVWEALAACFSGLWLRDQTWRNDETWLNE